MLGAWGGLRMARTVLLPRIPQARQQPGAGPGLPSCWSLGWPLDFPLVAASLKHIYLSAIVFWLGVYAFTCVKLQFF